MGDMLVKLYDLPPIEPVLAALHERGVTIRRALPPEKHIVAAFAARHFSPSWASECEVAFANRPVSCFIAVRHAAPERGYPQTPEQLLGFACYEVTCKGFFGPEGVAPDARGLGAGKGLLLACLHAMAAEGYAYAIIGWAGPVDFYRGIVGAIPIDGSEPGIFRAPLSLD